MSIKLNEQVLGKPESMTEKGLPAGVIARVTYPIMRLGVKNANNRIYEKAVAEKVMGDPEVLRKLKERNLFGNMEHPESVQVHLNPSETSHIISKIYLDEGTSILKADFDLLPTIAGKFIHVLLEAGCLVGVSTRAQGDLEERVDEAKNKYFRVIPESYQFSTVDFTGEPSTPDTLPENYVSAVGRQYEHKQLNKAEAVTLLENVKLDSAKVLCEHIRQDKQHEGCKCSIDKKECSGKCHRANEAIDPIEDKSNTLMSIYRSVVGKPNDSEYNADKIQDFRELLDTYPEEKELDMALDYVKKNGDQSITSINVARILKFGKPLTREDVKEAKIPNGTMVKITGSNRGSGLVGKVVRFDPKSNDYVVAVKGHPESFNVYPGSIEVYQGKADDRDLMAIENEDLNDDELIAKMQQWQESDRGVPAFVYDETKKRLGDKMPKDVVRLEESAGRPCDSCANYYTLKDGSDACIAIGCYQEGCNNITRGYAEKRFSGVEKSCKAKKLEESVELYIPGDRRHYFDTKEEAVAYANQVGAKDYEIGEFHPETMESIVGVYEKYLGEAMSEEEKSYMCPKCFNRMGVFKNAKGEWYKSCTACDAIRDEKPKATSEAVTTEIPSHRFMVFYEKGGSPKLHLALSKEEAVEFAKANDIVGAKIRRVQMHEAVTTEVDAPAICRHCGEEMWDAGPASPGGAKRMMACPKCDSDMLPDDDDDIEYHEETPDEYIEETLYAKYFGHVVNEGYLRVERQKTGREDPDDHSDGTEIVEDDNGVQVPEYATLKMLEDGSLEDDVFGALQAGDIVEITGDTDTDSFEVMRLSDEAMFWIDLNYDKFVIVPDDMPALESLHEKYLGERTMTKVLELEVEDPADEGAYEAEVEIEYSYDSNYGADADGNRGVGMSNIDDVKVLSLSRDGEEVDLKNIPPAVQKALDAAIENISYDDLEWDDDSYDEDDRFDESKVNEEYFAIVADGEVVATYKDKKTAEEHLVDYKKGSERSGSKAVWSVVAKKHVDESKVNEYKTRKWFKQVCPKCKKEKSAFFIEGNNQIYSVEGSCDDCGNKWNIPMKDIKVTHSSSVSESKVTEGGLRSPRPAPRHREEPVAKPKHSTGITFHGEEGGYNIYTNEWINTLGQYQVNAFGTKEKLPENLKGQDAEQWLFAQEYKKAGKYTTEYADVESALFVLKRNLGLTESKLDERELTPEQQKAIDMLVEEVKPAVEEIEKGVMTTKGHYGRYMQLLSMFQAKPHIMYAMALACIKAGANKQGVSDAYRIVSGRAFESKVNEGNRNFPPYDDEKSWGIKEQRPIPITISKTHDGGIRVKVAPMLMTYDTFSKINGYEVMWTTKDRMKDPEYLAKYNANPDKYMNVGGGSYDYFNGEATLNIASDEDLKRWLNKYKDIVRVASANESKAKRCKGCGVTLSSDFELEDEHCAQCQAELDEKNPDVVITEANNAGKFKVLHHYTYGWDDAWDNNVYKTRKEAQAEIDELIDDTAEAHKRGDMADEYKAEDYKIVRINEAKSPQLNERQVRCRSCEEVFAWSPNKLCPGCGGDNFENLPIKEELDISKYPPISQFSPIMSKEDLQRYGKDYYVKMAKDLEKQKTFSAQQKAEKIWKSLEMLRESIVNEINNNIEKIKPGTYTDANYAFNEMNDDRSHGDDYLADAANDAWVIVLPQFKKGDAPNAAAKALVDKYIAVVNELYKQRTIGESKVNEMGVVRGKIGEKCPYCDKTATTRVSVEHQNRNNWETFNVCDDCAEVTKAGAREHGNNVKITKPGEKKLKEGKGYVEIPREKALRLIKDMNATEASNEDMFNNPEKYLAKMTRFDLEDDYKEIIASSGQGVAGMGEFIKFELLEAIEKGWNLSEEGLMEMTINEANLSKEQLQAIQGEISQMSKDQAIKSLHDLHNRLKDKDANVEDGARYHFLKQHIKSLTGKEAGKAADLKTMNVRTESDFGPMKSAEDYTKKPVPKDIIYAIGNAKLGKDTMIFNMGAAWDCPSRKLGMCQVCIGKGKCYALKAEIQYQGDTGSALRKRRLQGQQWDRFPVEDLAAQMAKVIDAKGIKYVRINESGDFRSQADVDKVSKLADLLKGKAVVYMYTARKDLDFSKLSDNIVINGSGHMVHNKFQFVPKSEFGNIPKDANVCSGDCPNCSWCKTRGNKEILIKQH